MDTAKKRERIALFPGSFDPFTKGHAALVSSALKLFDRVVVGVGCNISKSGLLEPEQRVRLIDDYYLDEPRVTSSIYRGMTVDFAREIGAVAMVRGIRNSMDLEMERTLEAVNSEIYPELQTVMLLTPASVAHISSSCVRELLAFGRDVSSMMPIGINIEDYRE
ncbi:MAG: pantetheine-phosphate adenylyltransferase [Rikenellaceae bacterium]